MRTTALILVACFGAIACGTDSDDDPFGVGGAVASGGAGGIGGGSGASGGGGLAGTGGQAGSSGAAGSAGSAGASPHWLIYRDYDGKEGASHALDVGGPALSSPKKLHPVGPGLPNYTSLGWSPDGKRVAIRSTHQSASGQHELYVVEMIGATPGAAVKVSGSLVSGGDVREFVWSPDGTKLAFRADALNDEVVELFVVDIAGAKLEPPTKVSGKLKPLGDVLAFHWSPNSQYVAYLADQDDDERRELYAVAVSGKAPGPATKVNGKIVPGQGDVLSFEWSSGSDRIAYLADQEVDGEDELFLGIFGAQKTALKLHPDLSGGRHLHDFAWSPDGQRIALLGEVKTHSQEELYVVTFKGGAPGAAVDVSQFSDSGSDVREFKWSPTGQKIAMRANAKGALVELHVVDFASGSPTAPLVAGALPAYGEVYADWHWSPDGRWLLFRADAAQDAVIELWAQDVSVTPFPSLKKLSGAMPKNGSVFTVLGSAISPDSQRLVYLADQNQDEVRDAYVTSLTEAKPTPVKVSAMSHPDGDVDPDSFRWSRDSAWLSFRADADVENVFELFLHQVAHNKTLKAHPALSGANDVVLATWQP